MIWYGPEPRKPKKQKFLHKLVFDPMFLLLCMVTAGALGLFVPTFWWK